MNRRMEKMHQAHYKFHTQIMITKKTFNYSMIASMFTLSVNDDVKSAWSADLIVVCAPM